MAIFAAVVAALALLAVVPSSRALVERAVRADLDGDGAVETLVAATRGRHRRIVLYDRCDGRPRRWRLSRLYDSVDRLEVVEADGDRERPEFLFDGRIGAGGHLGNIRLMRAGGNCHPPDGLFSYDPQEPPTRPPRGFGVTAFSVELEDRNARYRGLELCLYEGMIRAYKALLPTHKRVSLWRYHRGSDRYVRYRARFSRDTTGGPATFDDHRRARRCHAALGRRAPAGGCWPAVLPRGRHRSRRRLGEPRGNALRSGSVLRRARRVPV